MSRDFQKEAILSGPDVCPSKCFGPLAERLGCLHGIVTQTSFDFDPHHDRSASNFPAEPLSLTRLPLRGKSTAGFRMLDRVTGSFLDTLNPDRFEHLRPGSSAVNEEVNDHEQCRHDLLVQLIPDCSWPPKRCSIGWKKITLLAGRH